MTVGLSMLAAGSVLGQVNQNGPADVGFSEPQEDISSDEKRDQSDAGFRIPQVEEHVAASLESFYDMLDQQQWEKAFARYPELVESTADRFGPAGEPGLYRPLDQVVTERIETLSMQGRAAFRLYFDAYAKELLDQVKAHPHPGSPEQLKLAERLCNGYLPATSSAEAGLLLGDLYFERGRFREAADCWSRTLAMHPKTATGEDGDLAILTRIGLARLNAGQTEQARAIAEGLAHRYPDGQVALGGESIHAPSRLLSEIQRQEQIDKQQPIDPNTQDLAIHLPKPGTDPAWAFTVVSEANVKRLAHVKYHDRHAHGLHFEFATSEVFPPIVADERAVYGHTLGSVFCLDLKTGKALWQTVPIKDAIERKAEHRLPSLGPHDGRIALTPHLVLVVDINPADPGHSLIVSAYDKLTGKLRWNTTSALPTRKACGTPIFHDGRVYLTTLGKDASGRDLKLHQLDPTTGQVNWSVTLGEMDLRMSPYTEEPILTHPVLAATDQWVFVLTNNGALLAVDNAMGKVQWGQKLTPPAPLVSDQPMWGARMPDPGSVPSPTPGAIVVKGQTLYVKESLSPVFYRLDINRSTPVQTREVQSVYAELSAVQGDSVVLLTNQMEVHDMQQASSDSVFGDASPRPNLLSANNFGSPASNCLVHDQTLYLLTHGQIQAVPIAQPTNRQTFTNVHLPEGRGGKLLAAPGRLICITPRKLVAFPIQTTPLQD